MGWLLDALRPSYPAALRARGDSYHRDGQVRIVASTATSVDAKVTGTWVYVVGLVVAKDAIRTACGCPYFVENAVCKHVWAVARAAEEANSFSESVAVGVRPELHLHYDEDEDAFEELDNPGDEDLRELDTASSISRAKAVPTSWREVLAASETPRRVASREIRYFLDAEVVKATGQCSVFVLTRGKGPRARFHPYSTHDVFQVDGDDQRVLALMERGRSLRYEPTPSVWSVPNGLEVDALRWLALTGRLHVLGANHAEARTALSIFARGFERRSARQSEVLLELPRVEWDEGEPWQLELALAEPKGRERQSTLEGELVRDAERRPLSDAMLVHSAGLVIFRDRAGRFESNGGFTWVRALRNGAIAVKKSETLAFVREYYASERQPRLTLPPALGFREARAAPRPVLELGPPGSEHGGTRADLAFLYGAERVAPADGARGVVDAERGIALRDHDLEALAAERVSASGFRALPHWRGAYQIADKQLLPAIQQLLATGVEVLAENRRFVRLTRTRLNVTSGVDWFGIDGQVEFENVTETISLPSLLLAVKKRERFVRLGDGSWALLPEEWLERWQPLALSARENGAGSTLRLGRAQFGLIDLAVKAADDSRMDAAFERLRAALDGFSGIPTARVPRGFRGELRGYQAFGLSWLRFHEQMGFGACLADDMGLGKTVQVLALLVARRSPRDKGGRPPALVVVPKTLIHNWQAEAARFAPGLRVHVHHGASRSAPAKSFRDADIVLTTYATLLRDIDALSNVPLDSVILDEAQAIKNAGTRTAKAVQRLSAPHRVAMTGTPIENHLGELWSLFEFLNPGLFDKALAAKNAFSDRTTIGPETKRAIQALVKPFLLRRTKAQVAPELPSRTEQTLWVDLDAAERKEYDEILEYYRAILKAQPARKVEAPATAEVLTALLRLRQAACHPGLLDASRAAEASSKLELLLEQLREVIETGHRVLVFSQFTSLLAIVKRRLDAERIAYEYLDGKTRDREARVRRFQEDSSVSVFLVSLKAGGVGLNLTSADYVFLLDPWWNPAAEAQAIDRTHRIGQTRPVVAYRLIARGTVEERVQELQDKKRALVAAVLGDDARLAGKLTRADLEALIS